MAESFGRKRSHYFSSFFIQKLLFNDGKYTFSNVKRWSKKFDVFSMDKIFFPINISNTHWTLAVIFMTKKEIVYYDSMSGRGDVFLKGLQNWLRDEHKEKKKGQELDLSEWSSYCMNDVPQQRNGTDCGVFTIVCADFLSDDLPLQYSQEHMKYFRIKIGADILRGHLTYPLMCIN